MGMMTPPTRCPDTPGSSAGGLTNTAIAEKDSLFVVNTSAYSAGHFADCPRPRWGPFWGSRTPSLVHCSVFLLLGDFMDDQGYIASSQIRGYRKKTAHVCHFCTHPEFPMKIKCHFGTSLRRGLSPFGYNPSKEKRKTVAKSGVIRFSPFSIRNMGY